MVAREVHRETYKEVITPAPVTGRRTRRKEKYTQRTMSRALLYGAAAVTAVLAYTIPFAGTAREGYTQNKIRTQIQEISRENEMLHTELASLKSPQRIAQYSVQSGLVMRDGARFVTISPTARTVSPKKSLLARLASFDF